MHPSHPSEKKIWELHHRVHILFPYHPYPSPPEPAVFAIEMYFWRLSRARCDSSCFWSKSRPLNSKRTSLPQKSQPIPQLMGWIRLKPTPFLLNKLISMDPKKCVTWDLGWNTFIYPAHKPFLHPTEMTVIAIRRVLCFTRSHLPLISSLHWHSTLAPLCNSLRKHQTPLNNFPRSSRHRCKDLAALVGSASGLAPYCQRPWSAPEPHPAVVDVAWGCLVNTRRAGRDGLITTNLLDRLTLTLDFLYATWFNPECNWILAKGK